MARPPLRPGRQNLLSLRHTAKLVASVGVARTNGVWREPQQPRACWPRVNVAGSHLGSYSQRVSPETQSEWGPLARDDRGVNCAPEDRPRRLTACSLSDRATDVLPARPVRWAGGHGPAGPPVLAPPSAVRRTLECRYFTGWVGIAWGMEK